MFQYDSTGRGLGGQLTVVVLRATVRVATLNGALALRIADVAIILSVRRSCALDR